MTQGERMVRTKFNPSADGYVDQLRQKSAELIDLVAGAAGKPEWDEETFREFARLQSLAKTHYELAAMYAVKMVTTG